MAESATTAPPPSPSNMGAPIALPSPSSVVVTTPAAPNLFFSFPKRPPIRLTSEFDSESSLFFHKVSFKLFDSLTKLNFLFQNDHKGQIVQPQVGFILKHLSIHNDAQEGEVVLSVKLVEPNYALDLSSTVPSIGLEEVNKILSVNGIAKGNILNGVCTAHYAEEDLKLRYSFKDEEISFIPTISLPSNALSFAFKRRFGSLDKLSGSMKLTNIQLFFQGAEKLGYETEAFAVYDKLQFIVKL
ncbi:hypothetical protein UlMin_019330 [Ulmus minor]